ncbi:HvfC/BufC family peptide modification chaperone [Burkholderia sp. F1]|uniref:HvfC/BufC family peptide modification chaperone n=1 Tax=Burkholderia sp. F1 TaxID=3366817 RepID=UPI003D71BD3B
MNPDAPTLAELQQAVRQSLTGAGDDASAWVASDGLASPARLSIHRNTATAVLVNALRLAFPAFERLVGADCFEGAARRFIAATLPDSAWLDAYGGAFPAFLAGLPQIASTPCLVDVARLEWQINVILHAPDAAPLSLAGLASLDDDTLGALRLQRHPAVALLAYDGPADAIWRAVLEQDDAALSRIDPASGPVRLLVQRTEHSIEVLALTGGEWSIAAALVAGEPIRDALSRALDVDGLAWLTVLLARGCFTDIGPAHGRQQPVQGPTS